MSKDHKKSDADQPSAAQNLAQWALAIRSTDIPEACISQAKLLLLDSIGCAIAAGDEAVCKNIFAVCEDVGGHGPCTIIGRSRTVDIPHAILANGTLTRMLDLNDYVVVVGKNGPQIGGHPSDNIPVALAAGEARDRSGRDILAAIVIGYEVFGRLKDLMDRKGPWDGVSISGFVAPVMAARLMGMDAQRLAHALALSGARAATPALVRHGGISAAKSIANAMVAQSAVEATLLAERGITGPLAILEHQRGMRSVFPMGNLETLTAEFPAQAYIMQSNVKAYPCVATGQSAVAAALKFHCVLKGKTDALTRIEVAMIDHPFIRDQQEDPKRVHPQSREAADHSFQFLVAVALTDGAMGPAQFEGERWRDPKITALMDKIVMTGDPALGDRAPGTYPSVLRVQDATGKEHLVEQLFPPGYSQGGISENDVVEKFHSVAAKIDRSKRDQIIAAALAFDRATNPQALISALRG
jgi:2-methylcitrate dehydratase